MIYEYECRTCGHRFDVEHPMSETQNPSEETLKKITCPDFGGCPLELQKEENINSERFVRVFSSDFLKFDTLSPENKRNMLVKRSKEDFKKNIEERKNDLQGRAMKEMKDIVKGK